MTANDRLLAPTPVGELLARLEQPRTVEALNVLLDNADLIVFLVTALDGFFRRGEVIADSLAEGASELRGAAGGLGNGPLAGIDLRGLAASAASLSGPVVAATPALGELLGGPLADPGTVRALSRLAAALAEGEQRAAQRPGGAPTGLLGLLRLLRDEEVSRGLGHLVEVARVLGRRPGPP
ncbi:MAG TPA: DUF1641 domain-containing protein [Actinocrinis sp.]|nr:DUF1641 domain-containing protein [Actinocrinis sp.]